MTSCENGECGCLISFWCVSWQPNVYQTFCCHDGMPLHRCTSCLFVTHTNDITRILALKVPPTLMWHMIVMENHRDCALLCQVLSSWLTGLMFRVQKLASQVCKWVWSVLSPASFCDKISKSGPILLFYLIFYLQSFNDCLGIPPPAFITPQSSIYSYISD